MKLIRLTDERYVLDAGPDIRRDQLEVLRAYWEEWWSTHLEVPETIIIGGSPIPLTYEDRREPDIESRLRSIEGRLEALESR